MLLPFEVQDSLIEYDPFPLFVEHTNQALCEILPLTGSVRPLSGNGRSLRGLRPKAHRHLQACKDVAVWDDLTVAWNKHLLSCTREVATSSHRHDSSLGWGVIFSITVNARSEDLSRLRIIYHSSINLFSVEGTKCSPLIANRLFMASVSIFLRPSFSALSSMYSRSF